MTNKPQNLITFLLGITLILTTPALAKEIWVEPAKTDQTVGDWAVTNTVDAHFRFGVPDDLDSVAGATLVVIGKKDRDMDLDVFLSISQDLLSHDDFTTSFSVMALPLVADKVLEIDVSDVFATSPALVPGVDYVGLHVSGFTASDGRVLGLRFIYDSAVEGDLQAHIAADLDLDPSNEIQTLGQMGSDVTLSDGGGTVSVNDADADSTNELITGALLNGNSLDITEAGVTTSVDLTSLAGGDADADPNNELQTIIQVDTSVELSKGGGTVPLNPNIITEGSNTAIGIGAFLNNTTGTSNTASGVNALLNNTTGFGNTATGFGALVSNTTGFNNTATGGALRDNTTGNSNTASGGDALAFNTTGSFNTATGSNTLTNNTTGVQNTATGVGALRDSTTGRDNTATGVGALRENTTGNDNTATGVSALAFNTTGIHNTASGVNALRANTTGRDNTATGVNALLRNTTGVTNTASGFGALGSNTTGSQNTASGGGALPFNTTGSFNTATGADTLSNNTTGDFNTASGAQVLQFNTTGVQNTATGVLALQGNTTGRDNTATGVGALRDNTTGFFNTATGLSALVSNTTGNNNTAIGFRAGFNLTTGDNNIYIDNEGVAVESNTIRIGTGGVHTSAFIAGVSGVTPGGAPAAVLINANGELGTVVSSRRFKEDIREMGKTSSGLMQLRPVKFRYKKEYAKGERPLQFGLIAEEVASVYPELVQYSATGEAQTVLYHQLPAMLLNALQKQHRQNQVQKEQIAELTKRLARLEQVLTAQQSFAALTK